jgi:RimJ/RimL family protein N-acetyltransferase
VTSISRRLFPAAIAQSAVVEPRERDSSVPAPLATRWRDGLPELVGDRVRLRELVASDAVSLQALLTTPAVTRAINAPPATVDAFERFVAAMRSARETGESMCFGIVPANAAAAVGLIQIRQLEPTFKTAEWGFVLGAPYWGTGLFVDAAHAVLDFAFDVVGVERLEARAALINGRGNGVLRKLGATQDVVLRRAFHLNGTAMDQALWSLLDTDWRELRQVDRAAAPVH